MGVTMRIRHSLMVCLISGLILVLPLLVRSTYLVYLCNILVIAMIFAMSLNLLFGYSGQISIGHGGFYAVGAYSMALLTAKFGFLPTLLISFLMGGGVAFFLGIPILRLRGHYLGLATLSFAIIVHFTAIQWVSLTAGPWGLPVENPKILGFELGGNFYLVNALAGILIFLLCQSLADSRIGRALRTIREDELVAKALGINVFAFKLSIFSLSGALAAGAGALYASLNGYVTPALFDINLSILVLVMVVLGGLGTTTGPLIGAGLITLLPELLSSLHDYELIIFGLILFFVLIFMPGGITGYISGKVRKVQLSKSGSQSLEKKGM